MHVVALPASDLSLCVCEGVEVYVCVQPKPKPKWLALNRNAHCSLLRIPLLALCRAQQAKCLSEIVIEFPNSSHQHNDNAHY